MEHCCCMPLTADTHLQSIIWSVMVTIITMVVATSAIIATAVRMMNLGSGNINPASTCTAGKKQHEASVRS